MNDLRQSLLDSLGIEPTKTKSPVKYNQMSPAEQVKIKERNQQIADRLRSGNGTPISLIAREFGVSTQCVYDVRRTHVRGGKMRRTAVNGHRVRTSGNNVRTSGNNDLVAAAEHQLKQARDNVILAEAAVLEARAQVLRRSVK